MKLKLAFIGTLSVFLFTGCATKGNWNNPTIADIDKSKLQYKKDDGYCDAVSYGAVPMPTPVLNNSSNKSGTFNAYNYETGQKYSGIYRTSNTGFSKGFNNGFAQGQVGAAKRARLNIWKSCMMTLGWVEKE